MRKLIALLVVTMTAALTLAFVANAQWVKTYGPKKSAGAATAAPAINPGPTSY